MSHNYQQLESFIKRQVDLMFERYKSDRRIERILEKHKDESRKEITALVMRKVFKSINDELADHKLNYFSKQSIGQVLEQTLKLWDDESLNQQELLSNLKELDLPVDLKSDYKVHSLSDILKEVDLLPKLELQDYEDVPEDKGYADYERLRLSVVQKSNRIRNLRERTNRLKTYHDLIESKIGIDRKKIQKNIPSSKSSIHEEVAKLKVILEKLKNLDDSKRKKLLKLLDQK